MKQNNPCYLFGMYGPDTGFVIINAINDTYTGTPIVGLQPRGLQKYVDAINEFN